MIQNPQKNPDRHQNVANFSLGYAQPHHKISSKSICNFISNPADKASTGQKHDPHGYFALADVIGLYIINGVMYSSQDDIQIFSWCSVFIRTVVVNAGV